jgi:hypothetical protein
VHNAVEYQRCKLRRTLCRKDSKEGLLLARIYDLFEFTERDIQEVFEDAVVATRLTWRQFDLGSPARDAYIEELANGLDCDE